MELAKEERKDLTIDCDDCYTKKMNEMTAEVEGDLEWERGESK